MAESRLPTTGCWAGREWDVGLVGLGGVIGMKKKLAFSFWITNHGANRSNFGSGVFFPMMSPQFWGKSGIALKTQSRFSKNWKLLMSLKNCGSDPCWELSQYFKRQTEGTQCTHLALPVLCLGPWSCGSVQMAVRRLVTCELDVGAWWVAVWAVLTPPVLVCVVCDTNVRKDLKSDSVA